MATKSTSEESFAVQFVERKQLTMASDSTLKEPFAAQLVERQKLTTESESNSKESFAVQWYGKLIDSRYLLIRKIEEGSFGSVYVAADAIDHKFVAIKVESVDTKMLMNEVAVYEALQGVPFLPEIFWSGCHQEFNFMAMTLLGPSLSVLLKRCGGRFSHKTIMLLADQMIQRLQNIHEAGFVHRDLKPGNFLIGLNENSNKIYLIDMGLVRRYKRNVEVEKQNANWVRFAGTFDYVSARVQLGYAQGPRDDLESLGFILVYFARGSLPWSKKSSEGAKLTNEERWEKKLSMCLEELCGKLPDVYTEFLNYCYPLPYNTTPDYSYLRQLCQNYLRQNNFKSDDYFDWLK